MLRTILEEAIEASLPSLIDCCTGASHTGLECLRVLIRGGLWPLSKKLRQESIAAVVEKILVLEEPKRKVCAAPYQCSFCNDKNCSVDGFTGQLQDLKRSFSSIKIGLCLDCVRTGRRSFQAKECRIKHEMA